MATCTSAASTSRRCRHAFVAQEPQLLHGSWAHNLTLMPDDALGASFVDTKGHPLPKWAVDDDVMWTALRRVGLDGRVELLPKKLHSPVTPADLTMEERQLLCLARALLRGCPVVVLDELERGVGGSVVRNLLLTPPSSSGGPLPHPSSSPGEGGGLNSAPFAKCTVLIIARQDATLELAQRAVVLGAGGQVLEDGPVGDAARKAMARYAASLR